MAKLKNAPNVGQQPKGKPYEAYIIAGSNAWDKTKQKTVLEWTKAEPNYQPIILGGKQLQEIDCLKLAVEVGYIAIYRAGELTEAEKSAICQNLAQHSTAETVVFYDEALQLEENASGYIARLRTENGRSVADKPKIKESDSTNDKARAFQKWLGLDLAFQCSNREIHAYNGKIWEKVEREQINRNVVTFLEENGIGYSKKSVTSLLETMEIQLPLMGEPLGDLVAFNNGVLNRSTLLFEPHNRQNWLTAYIPYSYDENTAETPHFDQWLNFVSDSNKSKAKNILAALYAILTNRYNWQVFFQVTGKGGSGKSIFSGIATLLAGEKNTASARLENFDDERGLAGFEDKKLIICSEQTKYAGDGGGLKAITGGDMVRVRYNYQQPFSTKIKALVMIVNNEPCKWTERNGGIERRIVNYCFDKVMPDNERDPYFMDKITLEIGGIIRKVLDTFLDVEEAKKALEEQKGSKEALEIKMESDPITAFFEYFYTSEELNGLFIGNTPKGLGEPQKYLYHAYLEYVRALGLATLNVMSFSKSIEQALKQHGNPYPFTKQRRNNGRRTNVHFKDFDVFRREIIQ
ncbi:DNA primase [Mannheimia granulomatis]|uniref:DNA primase n=1 Tax=Mannheimia granulomatis TaxID=85402 RepID=A0A6G8JH34_9PAST|nr:phage/plasmid primase, P4 family [Mannheimia granulomatis]QIM66522.1 DNA primase [Mannheimia granulomatis]